MRSYKFLFILGIIIALLALYKIFFLDKKKVENLPARPANPVLSVNAFIAKEEKADNKIFISGTAFANEEVNLMPEFPGKLTMLRIPEGKVVSRGTLLAKINDRELQAQLKKLRSEVSLLRDQEQRSKKLLEINSISREEYETSFNQLLVKNSEIELIQTQIAKTEIRAPFTGTIGFKQVGSGSYIGTNQVIAIMQQLDPIKIEFSVPEKYANLLKPGNDIQFTMDGSDEVYKAKINIIEPKIDIETRTIKVRALYANKKNNIKPGAYVKIEMSLKEKENTIMIPSEALIPILKAYKVFLFNQGVVKEAEVEIGIRTENEVQILKGLKHGDTIITSGIMSLKSGSKVQIQNLLSE